jgi:hypothetical protein
MLSDRRGETREITLTTGQKESNHNQPVVLIDDQITDLDQYL